jgi:hypothetical protein
VWVASALIGIAAAAVGFDEDGMLGGRADYEREQEAATIAAPGMLCTIAAAVLAVIVIRRITDREERLREAVRAAEPAAQAPPADEPRPVDEDLIAEDSRWRCPVCGWVFTDAESGRRHLERHHQEH